MSTAGIQKAGHVFGLLLDTKGEKLDCAGFCVNPTFGQADVGREYLQAA
jgi:hypothetical protein